MYLDNICIGRSLLVTYTILTLFSKMATPGSYTNPEHGTKLAQGNAKFALDLYKAICAEKENDANIFFSPASISIALAMTYAGARNKTSQEMKSAMALTALEDDNLHQTFQDLHRAITDTEGNYTMHIANRLFIEQNYKIIEEFLAKTQKHYSAETKAVDFRTQYEAARTDINDWVSKQTNDKIKDLMPQGSIDALTRLVLVNAVYFKGNWDKQFSKDRTHDRDFTLTGGKRIKTPMMFQKAYFNFGYDKNLGCKILELPYVGKKMSMFMLLPREQSGMDKLTEALTPAHLIDPVKEFNMRNVEVHVTIPKFKVEMSASMSGILQSLGMKELFAEGQADLSGIDGTRELFVSSVMHKAFVEVNEEGTEAAAATGVKIGLRSMPKNIEFIADHPFLYFIRESGSQSVLFLGLLQSPTASGQKDEL